MKSNLYLKAWRNKRGLSVARLAELSGRAGGYISEVENGRAKKNFTQAWLEDVARALGVSVYELQYTDPANESSEGIPVLGAVAANGETYHLWDYDPSVMVERLPVAMGGAEMALPIKGDSMFPRFKEGEYAIVGAPITDPEQWVGRDVVARVSDGRVVLKELARCPTGRWTLESVNPMFRRIEDVDLDWIRPVISNLIWLN